jgi:hypothetical protein
MFLGVAAGRPVAHLQRGSRFEVPRRINHDRAILAGRPWLIRD